MEIGKLGFLFLEFESCCVIYIFTKLPSSASTVAMVNLLTSDMNAVFSPVCEVYQC